MTIIATKTDGEVAGQNIVSFDVDDYRLKWEYLKDGEIYGWNSPINEIQSINVFQNGQELYKYELD